MILKQYYLGCLSHASYLVADEESGRAVVVDPQRDAQQYLDDADRLGLVIDGVINTHFHADFVAGHLEIAAATGAWIGLGEGAQTHYEARLFADGERVSLGPEAGVELEILHTPGHTWESISILVRRSPGEDPEAVLTGDTLFIGDVGRPDLAAAVGADPLELAAAQFASVRRLAQLPAPVRVLPAHGAGSACGKNLSTSLESTIGEQRLSNPLLAPMSREDFVERLMDGQPAIPAYFAKDAVINRGLRPVFGGALPPAALSAEAFLAARAEGAVVVDARDPQAYAQGHLNGSLNIGLDGRFAETLGMAVDVEARVLLVTEPGREEEARTRCARIGIDAVLGSLSGGEEGLRRVAELAPGVMTQARRLDWGAALREVAEAGSVVVDVRNPGEVAEGRVPGALHLPLAELPRRLSELPTDRGVVLHCAGGWRSSVAASIVRASGRADVADVVGGFGDYAGPVERPHAVA